MSNERIYRLYKYRSLATAKDRDRTARIVRDGYVYYAAPEQFNDPFDCRWCFSSDGELPQALRHVDPTVACTHHVEFMWREVNRNFCVFSLAGVNDNLLMWSHYSDSHRGVCLELEINVNDPPHEVIYTNERPRLSLSDIWENHQDQGRWEKYVVDVLRTKSLSWAYEQEHRLIAIGQRGERKIPVDSLRAITFGCKTPDSDKDAVREWVASAGLNVQFMQAVQNDCVFGVDIVETS